jgi:hypothetical protein
MTASFHILSNSSIICHLAIRYYVASILKEWLSNMVLLSYYLTALSTHRDYVQVASPLVITILWHVDKLLGNEREISKYTTSVAK